MRAGSRPIQRRGLRRLQEALRLCRGLFVATLAVGLLLVVVNTTILVLHSPGRDDPGSAFAADKQADQPAIKPGEPARPQLQPRQRASPSAGPPAPREPGRNAALTRVVPAPMRLRIARISVDTGLVRLGLNPDQTIQVPTRFDEAGWYQLGTAPGELGAAVIAGHVDSYTGPAVFYRLAELRPGDPVEVLRTDGSTVQFRVDRTAEVRKASFPTEQVYGPVSRPELRLITCGGGFDYVTRHYLDNVIVYAHQAP